MFKPDTEPTPSLAEYFLNVAAQNSDKGAAFRIETTGPAPLTILQALTFNGPTFNLLDAAIHEPITAGSLPEAVFQVGTKVAFASFSLVTEVPIALLNFAYGAITGDSE